jgi:hypothetical protein
VAFTSTPQTKTCLWGPRVGKRHLRAAAPLYTNWRTAIDETGAPIGVPQKLMRPSNVATTMNVYGNATLKHFHYSYRVGFVVSHPFHKEREKDGARSFLTPSVKMP